MPTVKQPEAGKKSGSTRKASPVTTKIVIEMPEKTDTPGTHRFQVPKDKRKDVLANTLYISKEQTQKAFGKVPKGIKVTIEPVF